MTTGEVSDASEVLHERVRRFMRGSLEPAQGAAATADAVEAFDTLACAIARHQARHVAAFRRLLRARSLKPEALRRAEDIPAIPTEAFKLRRIAAHPAVLDERCFRTSGTSGGVETRGQHPMRTTATYALGALLWGRAMLWPDRSRLRVIALVAPEASHPESSLGFMVARFAEALGEDASWHFDGREVDVEGAVRACQAAGRAGDPVLLAGTSFAFVHLCDALEVRTLPLPAGSRVMQTGGFKGRSREVDAGALRAWIAARFALPEHHVVAEYGMTELSSQLYQGSLRRAVMGEPAAIEGSYHAPPWLRVRAVDPATLVPLPAGQRGVARMVDLANVDTAVAVQTADEITVLADGSIALHGRLPGAAPRGCSLAVEHLLGEGVQGAPRPVGPRPYER